MNPVLQIFKQWLSISIFISTALLLLVWMPSTVFADHTALSNDRPPYTGNRAGGSRMWDGSSSRPNSVSAYLTCAEEVSWKTVASCS